METTRNPSCGCGCGHEVSRPHHRFIHGHSRYALEHEIEEMRDMLQSGLFTQYEIAEKFQVSQAYVSFIKDGHRKIGKSKPQEVMRIEEVDIWKNCTAAKRYIQLIRRICDAYDEY